MAMMLGTGAMEFLQALQTHRERMAEAQVNPSGFDDREGLVADFLAARDIARMVGFKLHLVQADDGPRASTALVSSLRPILLREMTIGRRHQGRILYGMLVETPYKLTSIMAIFEDGAGDAVAMSIYNAVEPAASRSTVESLYPKGMRLAVKEPSLKVRNDGRLVIRVDRPADIVDLGPPEDASLYAGDEETVQDTSREAVDLLREEGKRYFSEEKWDKAIQVYSKCIRVLEARADGDVGSKTSDATVLEQCTIVYSNRAEAWLRLDNHASALRDAVKALECDASHTKSMVRKVRALCGLQCYQEAILCLRNLLKRKATLHPQTRTELKDMLKEAEVGDKQSRLGVFDLNAYYRNGTKPSVPQCSDFVGPVEVRKVESDNPAVGRGLFVTRDVKAGDLLVVSNALAVSSGDPKEFVACLHAESAADRHSTRLPPNTTEDLITKLVELCRRYPRRRMQLYSLSDSSRASRSEVPPMTLFTPPVDSNQVVATVLADGSARVEVDVARIRRIVKINAFQGDEPEGPDMLTPTGLWVLPSFVNHSCVPNAKCSVVGDTLFLRAVRGIGKGEEITILYCCGHQPVYERGRTFLNQFEFECWCTRCGFERSLGDETPELNSLAKEYARLPAKDVNLTDEQTSELAAAGAKIAIEVEEVLERLHPLGADRKDWIRASFLRAYMCQASEQMLVAMGTCGWEPWAETMSARFDMMLAIVPDEEVLAHIAGAIHHLPVPKNWRCKWTHLAKSICTRMYGPLDEATLNTLVKRYSRVSLPL